MKRHVLIYGVVGGILITALKWTEYRFLVAEHSVEIYGSLIAATFAVLGIWLGLRLTGTQQTVVVKEVPVPVAGPFTPDPKKREDLGITPSISAKVARRAGSRRRRSPRPSRRRTRS